MDKVIVITGASSGIGAELARRASAAGAKVVLAARREQELEAVAASCGTEVLVVPTDVTRRAEVQALLDRSVARFGRVDVWVNNAGRGISRAVLELTDEDLDQMMTLNVKSALYGMQVSAAHFLARGSGQVINVSSMLGRVPFAAARSAYSASKHALNSLTANLRTELKAVCPAIRITLVMPGVVATDFGNNALGGGIDSRAIPGAQPVGEVAQGILGAIEHPVDEFYTRPNYLQQVADYFKGTERA